MNFETNKTKEILTAHGIKLSKSMGQNFLTDPEIPKKIVREAGFDDACGVLEIGPGLGALTMELCNAVDFVAAVELDKKLAKVLSVIFENHNNVDIIQGDALKINIKNVAKEKLGNRTCHVCANLPYNITTPLITAIIEADIFESLVIMIQKEVAARICAKAGSPEYGSFTIFSNYYSYPEILFDVSPECFFPRPKVTSTVLRMKIKKSRQLCSEREKIFFKVVRAAFGQRRKTLINALHAVFGNTYSKDEITSFVSNCGFDTKIRGEKLNLKEFLTLAEYF